MNTQAQNRTPMSLKRKLWLAIVMVLGLAFLGTFILSTLAAQRYFEQQLQVKNFDNVSSLALSMTQMPKDMVSIELLLAAQFDAGHYRWIRLHAPNGQILLQRENPIDRPDVPTWFVRMIPLRVSPGVADVQDGWNQFGRLELQSHDSYAYVELWSGSKKMLLWFVLLAVITGLLSSKLMSLILRPLGFVVEQAEAIGARRFISIKEPNTLEFRSLVRAMNTLSGRVKTMLQQESRRVEKLRQAAQFDAVTGLLNREAFIARLDSILSRDGRESSGVLAILRVSALSDMNKDLGHDAVNAMLRRASDQLQQHGQARPVAWTAGRLSGSDFAILAPGETQADEVTQALMSQWHLAFDQPTCDQSPSLPVGASRFYSGQSYSEVLAQADDALAAAEDSGDTVVRDETQRSTPGNLPGWREWLDKALRAENIVLGRYPVVDEQGGLLHLEVPVRLQYQEQMLNAGEFLAWVSRLGWMLRLDQLVLDQVWQQLKHHQDDVALNISPESMCDLAFIESLTSRLRARPDLARRLWLELPEHGALHHINEFRALCTVLKPLHCRVGLKHAGPGFSRIGELHDVGLDHLKLDTSLIRAVHEKPGNQAFLRGVCQVAHSVGLLAIAEGVQSEDERACLSELGLDGFTGPAIQS